jgi:hypothetical protein
MCQHEECQKAWSCARQWCAIPVAEAAAAAALAASLAAEAAAEAAEEPPPPSLPLLPELAAPAAADWPRSRPPLKTLEKKLSIGFCDQKLVVRQ